MTIAKASCSPVTGLSARQLSLLVKVRGFAHLNIKSNCVNTEVMSMGTHTLIKCLHHSYFECLDSLVVTLFSMVGLLLCFAFAITITILRICFSNCVSLSGGQHCTLHARVSILSSCLSFCQFSWQSEPAIFIDTVLGKFVAVFVYWLYFFYFSSSELIELLLNFVFVQFVL